MIEMKKTTTVPELVNPDGMAAGRFRVLTSVERDMDDDQLGRLRKRVSTALNAFPELTATTVTVVKADPDDGRYYAKADTWNDLVFVPTDHVINWITIYHELGHLAINRMDRMGVDVAKTSEEFCSILSVARMPPHLVEQCTSKNIPYLGTPPIPKREWPKMCIRALEYRQNNHDYVQECKRLLGLIGDTPDMNP